MDTLSLEQLVALFNIIGYTAILMTLISLSSLTIGDYLIEKLNLESKYPKLSKLIKLKQNLNKHYLMFYTIMLYIISILCILANIYILILKYLI